MLCAFPLAAAPAKSELIPLDQIGTVAGKQYHGGGLSVAATPDGARLKCVFQKLEGQATAEGLWLESTAAGGGNFRVVATAVGREASSAGSGMSVVRTRQGALAPLGAACADRAARLCEMPLLTELENTVGAPACYEHGAPDGAVVLLMSGLQPLAPTGMVQAADNLVRFTRPGLIEEYSVSVDGVRQDFLVLEPPALNPQPSTPDQPAGPLRVELSVTGAWVEPRADGARLVLEGSERKIAYNRLRATDATGKELPARIEVQPPSAFSLQPLALSLLVDDSAAAYPIRIDPTFSDDNWISMGGLPGANGIVRAAVTDAAGDLYIGGDFSAVGDVIANRVAKWNGTSWSALGSGLNSTVTALAVSGSDLYAGGAFTTAGGTAANYIAKWNGTNWSPLGLGLYYVVRALAVSGSDLYVGGDFPYATNAGPTTVQVNYIAKWDGSSWSALGSGLSSTVNALAVLGSDLFVAGYFGSAGGKTASRVAKWDGSNWSPLGSGVNGGVRALAVSGSDLYAGGQFKTAGGSQANYIAKWDGSSWSPLGAGVGSGVYAPGSEVNALAVSGSDLYVGGTFTYATNAGATAVQANYIARWNGSSWSALGSGMKGGYYSSCVNALAVSGNDLYLGGEFTTAGGSDASRIAKWDGSSWSSLGSGLNSTVYALALSGSDLYAGATTPQVPGPPPPPSPGMPQARSVGKWDGSSWSDLGLGLNGTVYALAVSGSDLYVGGSFTYVTNAGPATVQVNYIAKWNGSSWSPLGSGLTYHVYALAVSGGDLYVGGWFTTAGGSPANYIAKWDGSSWSALGSGLNGYVNALVVSGSDLYAGGRFTTAGGSPANYIAKWDGSSWSALRSGPNDYVNALVVSGRDLYVGGQFMYFTTAGGLSPANYIAKWDGSNWSPLGSGLGSRVNALAVSGSDLYVGGEFTTAGESPANYIAKWNGSSWSPLGSGLNSRVNALAVSGTNLYAGGNFTTAGGKVSAYVAKANITAAGGRFSSPTWSLATGFSCIFRDGTLGEPYLIQTSPSLAPDSWTGLSNFTYTAPITITDPSCLTAAPRYYRAVWNP